MVTEKLHWNSRVKVHHHQPEVSDLKLKYVGDIIMVKLSYDGIASNTIEGMGVSSCCKH